MPIFGDSNSFAIECSIDSEPSTQYPTIFCHLVLGNELIGNAEECDLLELCAMHLYDLRELIDEGKGSLTHPLFQTLNDREILELIYKSNQLEEEFNPAFSYLPALEEESLLSRHTFMLAESLDQHYLVLIEQDEKLKFIWSRERNTESTVRSVECDRRTIVDAISSCLEYLKHSYPNHLLWLIN